jgi:hypothetical protein
VTLTSFGRRPLQIVTVKVQGEVFHVHKELLVKDSLYFEKALNGSFLEGQTQEVVLDDILPADFGFYIDIVYRSFFIKKFVMRKEETGDSLSTKQILTFWQLSDRFLNNRLRDIAKESLEHRLSLYSEQSWRKIYQKRPSSDIEGRIVRLQDAYNQCINSSLPFEEDIIDACANCPPQVYADCVHVMEPDFMALVSQKMIMKHADDEQVCGLSCKTSGTQKQCSSLIRSRRTRKRHGGGRGRA